MKGFGLAVYLIWTLLAVVLLNFSIIFTTDINPNFIGVLFFVLFIQISIIFPIIASMPSKEK